MVWVRRNKPRTAERFVKVPYTLLQQQRHVIVGWESTQADESGMISLFRLEGRNLLKLVHCCNVHVTCSVHMGAIGILHLDVVPGLLAWEQQ